MKSVSGKTFAALLERRGWKLLRIHGSHHIYGKEGSVVRLSVPISRPPQAPFEARPTFGNRTLTQRRNVSRVCTLRTS